MRQIFLLRHAKSSWDDPAQGDFERPLSERGRRNARAMGAFLAANHMRPAMILCSAAERARATLEIIEPSLKGVPVSFEEGLYEATKGDLLHRLHKLDDHLPSVMLVGHNPGIERLAAFLVRDHGDRHALDRLTTKFPTCALAVLTTKQARWAALDDGCCKLADFVRPADLGKDGD